MNCYVIAFRFHTQAEARKQVCDGETLVVFLLKTKILRNEKEIGGFWGNGLPRNGFNIMRIEESELFCAFAVEVRVADGAGAAR